MRPASPHGLKVAVRVDPRTDGAGFIVAIRLVRGDLVEGVRLPVRDAADAQSLAAAVYDAVDTGPAAPLGDIPRWWEACA